MKFNLSPLTVGTVALVSPALSFAIIQTIIPYSAASVQNMVKGSDISRLSLSAEQQQQLRSIQLGIKPRILSILNSVQKRKFEEKLAQDQSLPQAIASLDLSKDQQLKVQGILKYQVFNIVKILTPEQREQLIQSSKPFF